MLIINADDWGLYPFATDRILSCRENKWVASTSAMMFVADSERSAERRLNGGLEIGLHLNFTDRFTGVIGLRGLINTGIRSHFFCRRINHDS